MVEGEGAMCVVHSSDGSSAQVIDKSWEPSQTQRSMGDGSGPGELSERLEPVRGLGGAR